MIAVSKAWNRLLHRYNKVRGGAKTSASDARRPRRVRYSETHCPSGVPRVSPKERARRKAMRTAEKKARRRNRGRKSDARRRGGGCSRSN
jgi:hypothetical protein